MKKKLVSMVILLVFLALPLAACAPGSDIEVNVPETTLQLTTPGPNPVLNQPDNNGRVAGVAQGLWHGLIAPLTLVGSFFNPALEMYEVHNNGREYNLGFLFGVALVFLALGVLGGRRR
jgi:ABC-type oligopeptide transport system substrate-binding subunit